MAVNGVDYLRRPRSEMSMIRSLIAAAAALLFLPTVSAQKHPPEGYLVGTSANYIPVLVEKADCQKRSLAPVKLVVEKVENDLRVFGKPV